MEYDEQSTILRLAGSLGSDFVELKHHAYEKFVSYNSLRLKLEGELTTRLALISNYFYHDNISDECKVFYHKQMRELTQAYYEPNSLKAFKLTIYSKTCPYTEPIESASESDEDFDFWPFLSVQL